MAAKRRYFTRIEGEIQGGVDVELGPYTLVYGTNASGKDTIVRALTAAARGAVDDLAGKDDVRSGPALADLAPGRKGRVYVRALDTNGDVASYTLAIPEPGKTSRPKHEPLPGVICPVVDLRTNLLASDDTRRKWLVGLIADSLTSEQILTLIPGPLVPEYQALESAVRAGHRTHPNAKTNKPIDWLVAVREEVKVRAATANREVTAAEATASQLGASATAGGIPTAGEVEAAGMEVEQLRARLLQIPIGLRGTVLPTLVSESEIASVGRLAEERDAAGAAWQQHKDMADALENWLLQVPAAGEAEQVWADETTRIFGSLRDVAARQIAALQERSISCCVLCNNPLDADALAHADAAIRMADQALAEVEGMVSTQRERGIAVADLERAKQGMVDALARWDALNATITDIQERTAEQERQRAAVRATTEGDAAALETKRADVDRQLQEAVASHANLTARYERHSSVRQAQAIAATKEQERDRYKRLGEALDRVIREAFAAAKDAFVREVQTYMPPAAEMPGAEKNGGATFDIALTDGARDICDIGLRRTQEDGSSVVHTALSGAEEVIVQSAMAIALGIREANRTGAKDPLILVTLRERGIHPNNLGAAMRAIAAAKAPVQIVWTNTLPPNGRKPAGWTLIDADAVKPPAEPFDRARLGGSSASTEAAGDDDVDADAKAAAAEAAAEARAAGATAAEVRAAAEEAAAAVVEAAPVGGEAARAVVLGTPGLPFWAADPGRALPTLALDGGGVEAVVQRAYPGSGRSYTRHPVVEGDAVVRVWHCFDSGLVARVEAGRILMYQGRCVDPLAGAPTVPVWGKSPELGRWLCVVNAGPDGLDASLRALLPHLGLAGLDSSEDPLEVLHAFPAPGHREWVRHRCGLVAWRTKDSASLFAGPLDVAPEIVSTVQRMAGLTDAGVGAGVVAAAGAGAGAVVIGEA